MQQGMRGNMGGGMPYGYGGMMGGGYGMRGPMNPMMRGGRGGGGMAGVKPVLTLADVQGWLEKQQPFVLQTVMKTCTNLLVTKHDVPAEDLTDWYSAADAAGDNAVEEEQTKVVNPPKNKGTLLSGGVDPLKQSSMLNRNPQPGLGWTTSDRRHPHRVSTKVFFLIVNCQTTISKSWISQQVTGQMKPLPEMDIIPPFSAENKEADVDRDKRKMLTNNVNMMQMEVTGFDTHKSLQNSCLGEQNLPSVQNRSSYTGPKQLGQVWRQGSGQVESGAHLCQKRREDPHRLPRLPQD